MIWQYNFFFVIVVFLKKKRKSVFDATKMGDGLRVEAIKAIYMWS